MMTSLEKMNRTEKNAFNAIISTIIATRKERKISQYRLAEMCKLPQATISRLESFNTEPKLSTIIKICNALEIKIVCYKR